MEVHGSTFCKSERTGNLYQKKENEDLKYRLMRHFRVTYDDHALSPLSIYRGRIVHRMSKSING